MSADLVLARIDKAKAYLAEARDLIGVKNVIALAVAAKVYADQVGASIDAVNYASEIRLRVERRLGELLAETPKNKGGGEKGIGRRGKECGSKSEPHSERPTLAESGISKKLSSRAQRH